MVKEQRREKSAPVGERRGRQRCGACSSVADARRVPRPKRRMMLYVSREAERVPSRRGARASRCARQVMLLRRTRREYEYKRTRGAGCSAGSAAQSAGAARSAERCSRQVPALACVLLAPTRVLFSMFRSGSGACAAEWRYGRVSVTEVEARRRQRAEEGACERYVYVIIDTWRSATRDIREEGVAVSLKRLTFYMRRAPARVQRSARHISAQHVPPTRGSGARCYGAFTRCG